MASKEEIQGNIQTHLPNLAAEAINLPEMVRSDEDLRLSDANGPQKAPKSIGKYGLVGMVEVKGVGDEPDRLRGGGEYIMPHDVVPHHEGYDERKRPLLETSAALGLTVEKDGQRHLCAVAAAKVNDDGSVEIVQIQGTNTDGELKSQLGGFRASAALIKAWGKVAAYTGAKELVVSESDDKLNRITDDQSEEVRAYNERQNASLRRNYDGAAERAGLKRTPGKRGWRQKVEPKPMPKVGSMAIPGGPNSVGAVRRAIRTIADDLAHGEGGQTLGRTYYHTFEAYYEVIAGDLDNLNEEVFVEMRDEYKAMLKKVEAAIAAVHPLIEAMIRFEQKL